MSKSLPNNQAELDAAIIDAMSTAYGDLGELIIQQFRLGKAIESWGSGTGCFSTFEIPDQAPKLPPGTRSPIDGPRIFLRGVQPHDDVPEFPGYGQADSLLFLEEGKIDMLECYAIGEGWPTRHYDFKIIPMTPQRGR